MNQIQYLPHTELVIHPQNMRRTYPPDQVQQMAQSIRECGILQPLIAVPIPNPCHFEEQSDEKSCPSSSKYHIIAGNLRLRAVQSLGDDAPLVPVIIRDDLAPDQQLLDMAVENAIRFDPDPVSEGLHYHRLLQQPGMNANKLYQLTGIAPSTIQNRLLWSQTEPEIQDLAIAGSLQLGAIEQLIRLPAGEIRIETARRLARVRSSLPTIQRIINGLLNQIEKQGADARAHRDPDGPAVGLAALDLPALDERKKHTPIRRGLLRAASAVACQECPNKDSIAAEEPAWTLLAHACRETCQSCGLAAFRNVCIQCPLMIALRTVYKELAKESKEDQ